MQKRVLQVTLPQKSLIDQMGDFYCDTPCCCIVAVQQLYACFLPVVCPDCEFPTLLNDHSRSLNMQYSIMSECYLS